MDKSNVIDFASRRERRNYPLFAPELRAKLEHGMSGFTEKHCEAVTSMEQVICAHMISAVRGWAWKLGERLGNRIADGLFGEE
jgi:hypothetical protein